MVFASFLKRKKETSSAVHPDIERVLDKIMNAMQDENLQNSMYPALIRPGIIGGDDCDGINPDAEDFGHCIDNPTPVNGSIGEIAYLSLLQNSNSGKRLLFHRLGSINRIDIYESVSMDGCDWEIFFLSMYHPRKSRRAPVGYRLAKFSEQPLFYGTNQFVHGFPHGLHDAICDATKRIFGFPLPPPQVRQAEGSTNFERPSVHQMLVTLIRSKVSALSR
jgi:hypothetical protein